MRTIVLRHSPSEGPFAFRMLYEDGGESLGPITVTPPTGFAVEGGTALDLPAELRWYLSGFLSDPSDANADRADTFIEALEAWGDRAFDQLFGRPETEPIYEWADEEEYGLLALRIESDDASILAWPWEALRNAEGECFGVKGRVHRCPSECPAPPGPAEIHAGSLGTLLLAPESTSGAETPRPLAPALADLIGSRVIGGHLHVLRPATTERLAEHLSERPGVYDMLAVEGDVDSLDLTALGGLLAKHRVPLVLLAGESPDAPLALLSAGVRGVVLLPPRLTTAGVRLFLGAFHRALALDGDLTTAVQAGRQAMADEPERACAAGRVEVLDFFAATLYVTSDAPVRFAAAPAAVLSRPPLAEEAQEGEDPYGCQGRGAEIVRLDGMMRETPAAILIHGPTGIGKTTVARGFVRRLRDTDGMDAGLWVDLREVHSAEVVVNAMGRPFLGDGFVTAPLEERVEALARLLLERRIVTVWDQFEAAFEGEEPGLEPNLGEEDRRTLAALLDKAAGGQGKVLLTSRSSEEWLTDEQCSRLALGGLSGEGLWTYCEAVYADEAFEDILEYSDERGIVELMDQLDGHPVAVRAMLSEDVGNPSREIPAAASKRPEGGHWAFVMAALGNALDHSYRRADQLRIPTALQRGSIDASLVMEMAKLVRKAPKPKEVPHYYAVLSGVGLTRAVRGDEYELPYALTEYLNGTVLPGIPPAQVEPWRRAFVQVFAGVAQFLVRRPESERRPAFRTHRANLRRALAEAEALGMRDEALPLLEALAEGARVTSDHAHAASLYARIAEESRDEAAVADAHYCLGLIADERSDLDAAEAWYGEALATYERAREGGASRLSYTLYRLGCARHARGDLEGAEGYCRRALEAWGSVATTEDEDGAAIQGRLALIAEERGDLAAAEERHKEALALWDRAKEHAPAARVCDQLGALALRAGDAAKAEEWYGQALERKVRRRDMLGAAWTQYALAEVSIKQGDLSRVEAQCLKAIEVAEQYGDAALGSSARERMEAARAELAGR